MSLLDASPACATPLPAASARIPEVTPGAPSFGWSPAWESLPAAVAVVNTEGCILGRSTRFGGSVPTAVPGALAAEAFAEAFPEWPLAFERAGAGEALSEDVVARDAGGTRQWLRWELQPWRDDQGRVQAVWVALQSITPQKQAEAELLAAYGAFEQMNAQLEEAITRANSLATEAALADQAKSAFLAMMSHEIRTPLTGVIGMANILEHTPLTDEQREFLRTIRISGDALLAVINDTLDYSKIEAGHLELEETEFDLRACVDEALDLLAGRAVAKRLELVARVEEDVPLRVRGDGARVRQILLNLLGNAVKFTDRGEVVVEVRQVGWAPEASAGPACVLEFAVRDTGAGIPKERQDRLFKTFSQVDSSTARTHGGTGLGLAISKRLAELMGGRMWVESEAGCGSTFRFTLAARPVPAPRAARPKVLRKRRVLLVEDNATTQRVLSDTATSCGLEVEVVDSVAAARRRLEQGPACDLMVLDEVLPDGTGQDVLRQLPSSLRPKWVVGYSVLTGQEFAGVDVVLHKPVKPPALIRAWQQGFDTSVTVTPACSPGDDLSGTATREPLRILLAEDNPVNQRVALLMLARLGYTALAVGNGADAIEALAADPYDVVLMDVQMPVLDGLEATRTIRAQPPAFGMPWIIALTAGAMKSDRDQALAAGMDDFLTKPIRFEVVQAALSRAVAARRGR